MVAEPRDIPTTRRLPSNLLDLTRSCPTGSQPVGSLALHESSQGRPSAGLGLPLALRAFRTGVSRLVRRTLPRDTGRGHGSAARHLQRQCQGGHKFFDTADVWQFGQSGQILGKPMTRRRNDVVLSTKYTTGAARGANRLVTGISRTAVPGDRLVQDDQSA